MYSGIKSHISGFEKTPNQVLKFIICEMFEELKDLRQALSDNDIKKCPSCSRWGCVYKDPICGCYECQYCEIKCETCGVHICPKCDKYDTCFSCHNYVCDNCVSCNCD